jgi:hypothetical protein
LSIKLLHTEEVRAAKAALAGLSPRDEACELIDYTFAPLALNRK